MTFTRKSPVSNKRNPQALKQDTITFSSHIMVM